MSELRQDPTTEEWVIIARERSKRPDDFIHHRPEQALPVFSPSCPFCPGNEGMTPPTTLLYQRHGGSGWQIRAFANKFAALNPDGVPESNIVDGFFTEMSGTGAHEVIVETPLHNGSLTSMTDGEVTKVLQAYQERYNALSKMPSAKFIIIFKNHGSGAGTSLKHTHSQLVVTPVLPKYVSMRHNVSIGYYDKTGRCLYSDLVERELEIGKRVVLYTDKFVVLHPFASKRPFETWIIPRRQQACFGDVSREDLGGLANVLRVVLLKFQQGLNNPDFNYVIDSAPIGDENGQHYMWHMRIVPRLTEMAGFEIGSGMYITTAVPEETTQFMRDLGNITGC
jgi:UDPglucose--hexose-1-phosphate uridylyltransferase